MRPGLFCPSIDTISKAAIKKLGEVMAHELAEHKVRVNTVEPGHISTHFERLAYDAATLTNAATNIPQGRLGTRPLLRISEE